ncbi:MAG: PAS domain-containing protein, partial [Candidatus Izemoplasma sp.]
MGRLDKRFNKKFNKIDAFSLELIKNFVEKGFIVDSSKNLVYTIGYINDVIKNNDFQSLNDFTISVQKIITDGIEEAKDNNKPFMYQNVSIKQMRYNIAVLSLANDTYFLISFEKLDRLSQTVLNYNKDSERNLDVKLNEISNFLNNSLISAISIDLNKNVLNYTTKINELFEFEDTLIGDDISQVTPKFFNFPRILTNINAVIMTGSIKTLHTKTKDNVTYNVRISPYMNLINNQQIGVIISFQDITILKANEEELIRKKEEVEKILDSLNLGMINCEVITDETNTPIDLKVLYVNERIIDFLHLEKKAFVGKTVLDLLPNIDKSLIELYGNIGLTMKPHRQVHYLDFGSNNNPAGYRDIHGLSVIKGQVILTFINVTDTINAQKETEDKILRHSMV